MSVSVCVFIRCSVLGFVYDFHSPQCNDLRVILEPRIKQGNLLKSVFSMSPVYAVEFESLSAFVFHFGNKRKSPKPPTSGAQPNPFNE